MAPVERVAQQVLLAEVHVGEGDLDASDDAHGAVGAVGDRGVGVDGRDLERQIGSADARQVGGEHEQVGAEGQRRQAPVEVQGEAEGVGRVGLVVGLLELDHQVLEGEEHPRVDLERQM